MIIRNTDNTISNEQIIYPADPSLSQMDVAQLLPLGFFIGSFGLNGLVERLLTARSGGLNIIVFALESTIRIFSSQDLVNKGLFAISVEKP